jgi:hypothetical protein
VGQYDARTGATINANFLSDTAGNNGYPFCNRSRVESLYFRRQTSRLIPKKRDISH